MVRWKKALKGNTPKRTSGLQKALNVLVALVFALPAALWTWSQLPPSGLPAVGGFDLDKVLVFLAALAILLWLLHKVPVLCYGAIVLAVGVITVLNFEDRYGFGDLFKDYGLMLSAFSANTKALPEVEGLRPFVREGEVRDAIDYRNPVVRSFAVKAATTWFKDEAEDDDFTMVQAFSIFKVINSAWVYVSDPMDDEYFASASESVPLLAGDCDDHAVLMAACIKAIGGKARLVRTTGHIYPEMNVGDAQGMQRAAYLIRNVLFPDVARHAALWYHTDANGDRWINLDYTRHYPGGEVMNEKIVGILYV